MNLLRLSLAVLAACLACDLSAAEVRITAPESAPVGSFILIDASHSTGELSWSVPDKEVSLFLPRDNRQAIVYSPKAKRCRYIVTAKDAAGTATFRDAIDFTGTGPDPAPAPMPPAPGPDKPRTLPDGKFKAAQGSHDHALKVEARAEHRRAEAELVAAKLEGIRDRIKSGELDASKPQQLITAIQTANSQLPQDVHTRWKPWGNWWGKFLYGIYVGGSLKTAADWILIFEETILGLRAVM